MKLYERMHQHIGVEQATLRITIPQAVIALCSRFAIDQDEAVQRLLEASKTLESECTTEAQRLAITTQAALDLARHRLEQGSAQ